MSKINRKKQDIAGTFRRMSVYFILVVATLTILHGCEDEEMPVPEPETSTMLDIDGNQYRTVKIGNQWWMAENLKVTRFRNGQSIYEAVTTEDWIAVPSAYCLYGGSAQAPGFLYNWGAVSDTAGLAPEGWRIPTDDDWKQLERVIGMTAGESDRTGWRGSDEGEKLKMEALTGWAFFDNVWATNESGFSAEAGSCRLFDGTFGNPGLKYNGFWWTISENGTDEAWFRNLDYKKRGVFRYYGLKKYGFSVRCVKIQ